VLCFSLFLIYQLTGIYVSVFFENKEIHIAQKKSAYEKWLATINNIEEEKSMENKQTNSYYAFISYSRKDIKDAKWIHSSLEKFHIPTKLPRAPEAEPIPKPLRCFRDINDLDVMPESFVKGIENALSASKYLVVVCSPNSARSAADGNHYVDWEIQKFIEVHGLEYAKNHILPVIISGEISHNTKETECLPPSLYKLGDDFLTHNFPILDYGDENVLTKDAKNDFILKILAFLLQVKYSVLNDRYQKAQRKRRHFILGAALSLVAVFAVISVYAAFGWRSANKNLAFSHYVQANTLIEQGETSYALAYYKKSLQLDENPIVCDKVYNLITNGSWLVEKDSVTEISEKNFDEKYSLVTKNKNLKQIIDNETKSILYSFENVSDWKISPDGQFLVYSSIISNSVTQLVVYNLHKKEIVWTRREKYPRYYITFSPDNVHFSTTGSIFFQDSSAKQVTINNVFHEDEKIIMDVNGVVSEIQFSNDGRKIAVATNKNSLHIFAVRDGSEIVNSRMFDKRILSMIFTPDDNSIQVNFENIGRKEYTLRVNKLGFDLLKTPLYAGVIHDSVLLKQKYVCNIVGNSPDGYFIEIQNVYDNKDYFITPFKDDVKDAMGGAWKIKKSPSEKFVFLYDFVREHTVVEIFSVDFKNKNYLTYQKRVELPYFVESIDAVSDNLLLVLCDKEQSENLYFIDFSQDELELKTVPVSYCLAFRYAGKNELYTISSIGEKENGLQNYALKKFDLKTMSEKWSVPLENLVVYPNKLTNICMDKKENLYIVSDKTEISIFNNSGKLLKQIKTTKNISYLALSEDESLLAVGNDITSVYSRLNINEVEVVNLKDDFVLFRTEYTSDTPVDITKIAFSKDSKLLYLSGENQIKQGFFDVWDLHNFSVEKSSFGVEIPKVYGFDFLSDDFLLYTSKGVLERYLFNSRKTTMVELQKDDVYSLLGGWTLNKYDIPQLLNSECKKDTPLCKWLTENSYEKRTIHPKSETLLIDMIESFNTNKNRNVVLDIQSDNALALDNYYFDVIDSISERNFKKKIVINSQADELKRDNDWELQRYGFSWWKTVLNDEETSKVYKFQLDNYLKKVPESVKPLEKFRLYYLRSAYYLQNGNEKRASEIYEQMLAKYPEEVLVKLLKLNESNFSNNEKKSVFDEIRNSKTNYSFSDLKELFEWYEDNLAQDSSFEEINETVSWFMKSFKKNLDEDFFANASKCSSLFDKLLKMTQLNKGGLDYWLECVEYIISGTSDSEKILLNLDSQILPIRMMNSIAKKDTSYIPTLFEKIDYDNLSFEDLSKNIIFYQNLYMYLSLTKNPQKDLLLEKLLDVDSALSYEYMASAILTDIRIYKKLGNNSICSETDIQKVISSVFNLMSKRLDEGKEIGLEVFDVLPTGKGSGVGLRKGDRILFYDNYPVSNDTRDFFMYDLHTCERNTNKSLVEIVVIHDGRVMTLNVEEGLLGIQL